MRQPVYEAMPRGQVPLDDGGQHAETTARDHEHAKALEAMGYLVLGFWNNDVLQNTDGVVVSILDTLNKQPSDPPHPRPLPNGERAQA
jgi:very-short-patch-repair endonuclease